jgi:hypothetical protein
MYLGVRLCVSCAGPEQLALTCELLEEAAAALCSHPHRAADVVAARGVGQAAQAVAHKLIPADMDTWCVRTSRNDRV